MLKEPLLSENESNNSEKKEVAHNANAHSTYVVRPDLASQFTEEELESMRNIFSRFDVNGDGGIDENELSAIMEMIGEPCSKQQLRTLMADADTDGDGSVSFEEFADLVDRTKKVRLSMLLFEDDLVMAFIVVPAEQIFQPLP